MRKAAAMGTGTGGQEAVRALRRAVTCALLLCLWLPLALPAAARADAGPQAGPWYRYQGEPSSYDRYDNQNVNCGPTSVAMAIQYAEGVSVPIRQVRALIGKNKRYTDFSDLARALDHWAVRYSGGIVNARSIEAALARGHIVIVALDMRKVSPGADVDGRSADPSLRTGRYETYATLHWIVVRGVTSDGRYFVVYDGNVWGGPGNPLYWYSDGTPKGMNRYYAVDQVQRGMFVFGADTSKGFEIYPSVPRSEDTSPSGRAPFGYDSSAKPPSSPVVSIVGVPDGGATISRYVTLRLGARDGERHVTGMMISNNPYFTDAFEEPFAPEKQWTLEPGDGAKTVYVRFKNSAGAWSDMASVRVELREEPPIGSLVVAPDPRIVSAAHLSDTTVPSVGPMPAITGQPEYRPLGPNLLSNSSFELWADGIPAAWDSPMRSGAYRVYEPDTDAYHGSLALRSESGEPGSDLTQKVIIHPGAAYTLSAWVRGSGSGVLYVQELESQGAESALLTTHSVATPPSSDWRMVRLTFRASPEATDALVGLRGAGVLWDAIQLEQGSRGTDYQADGVLIQPPAMNLVPNSSAERGAEGWSGLNSWVSIVTSPDYAYSGTRALKITKQKPGPAATIVAAHLQPGRTYTLSAYARLASGGPVTSAILDGWLDEGAGSPGEVDTSRLTDANRPEMTWEPVGAGWYRGAFTFTARSSVGVYGVYSTSEIPVDGVYYLDAVQIEEGRYATAYLDGSMGRGYSWAGTPYLSTSGRGPVSLGYGTTRGHRGTLQLWARPAGGAPANGVLVRLGDLTITAGDGRITARSGDRVIATAPFAGDVAKAYAVTWDGPRVSFYQSGRLLGSAGAGGPAPGSRLWLGPGQGEAYPDAVVGDVSLWSVALPDSMVTYLAEHAPLDPGRRAVNTRRIEVATSAVSPSGSRVTIEWSTDGETWHPWERVNGLHAWELEGRSGAQTVWVRYTDEAGNWLAYSDRVVLDRIPPRVLGVSVTPRGELTVRFSEPVDPESLLEAARVEEMGRTVQGTWSYAPDDLLATFLPSSLRGASARLVIGTALRDEAGNRLATEYNRIVTLRVR